MCVYRVSPSGKLASSHEFTHRITFTVEHSARDLYLINPLAGGAAAAAVAVPAPSPFYCPRAGWCGASGPWHKQQPSTGTRMRRIRLRMCVTCRILICGQSFVAKGNTTRLLSMAMGYLRIRASTWKKRIYVLGIIQPFKRGIRRLLNSPKINERPPFRNIHDE